MKIALSDSVIKNYYGPLALTNCSIAANVRLSGDNTHEYFLTAGHCTGTDNAPSGMFGPNHGAIVYQPDSTAGSTAIATEYANPTGRTGLSGCPSGYTCKYSDAALFQYINSSRSNFAYIARDSTFSSTLGVAGSRFRVDSFHVVGEIPEANLLAADTVPGQYDTWMHKVGFKTGWTWGQVTSTCRTLQYPTTSQAMLCQYVVTAEDDFGDSGAPTFWWVCCSGPNQAWLGGILSSGYENAFYFFSSISGIKNDIANLVTY